MSVIFIGGIFAHLFAIFQGLLKMLAGINFTITSKSSNEDGDFTELYMVKWTMLLIPPTTLLIVNLVGMVAGISYAVNSGYQSWWPFFGKVQLMVQEVLLLVGSPKHRAVMFTVSSKGSLLKAMHGTWATETSLSSLSP